MTPEYARVMARYNRWMNDKVSAVTQRLTDQVTTLLMQAAHHPVVTDLVAMLRA